MNRLNTHRGVSVPVFPGGHPGAAASRERLSESTIGPTGVVILIMVFYIFAGMFVDGLAVVLSTIPIFHPVVVDLGLDSIWLGVLLVSFPGISLFPVNTMT